MPQLVGTSTPNPVGLISTPELHENLVESPVVLREGQVVSGNNRISDGDNFILIIWSNVHSSNEGFVFSSLWVREYATAKAMKEKAIA
ncbi:hypothetical protein [Thermococcus thermotolerans]|uniref:hypothetical protein n=1 Tax=Thermococcus thermotolerans TaxID=2969672 RepID=UPI00280589DD|nr:hypothetical protein [Thermococcus thermotolerans]